MSTSNLNENGGVSARQQALALSDKRKDIDEQLVSNDFFFQAP